MRSILSFLFFFFAAGGAFANKDDVSSRLDKARTHLHSSDTSGVAKELDAAEQLLSSNADSIALYHFHILKGEQLFTERGTSDSASFAHYVTALSIATELGSDSLLADAYFNLGLRNYQFNNYGVGLKNLLKAIPFYKRLGNENKIAYINRINGIIHIYLGDLPKAIQLFNESRIYWEKVKNEMDLAAVLNNMGLTYSEMNDSLRAMEYFYKSLVLREKLKDGKGMGQICNNIGQLLLKQGANERALSYLQRGYDLRIKNGAPVSGLAESLVNIGRAYIGLKQFGEAKRSLEEGFDLAKKDHNPEIQKRAMEFLKDIYLADGDYKKAYEAQNMYHRLRDSVFSLDKSAELMRISVSGLFERKMLEDSLKSAEQKKHDVALQQEKDERNAFTRNTMLVGMLVLLGVAFMLYKRNEEKKRTNEVITQQRDELKIKQKEIIDSITYAKKIQQSQLTNERYIEKTLSRLRKK